MHVPGFPLTQVEHQAPPFRPGWNLPGENQRLPAASPSSSKGTCTPRVSRSRVQSTIRPNEAAKLRFSLIHEPCPIMAAGMIW